MYRILFFVFGLLPLTLNSQIYPGCCEGCYFRVTAPSGLNLREQPAVRAGKIGSVPHNAVVLGCNNPCEDCAWDSIDGRYAPWLQVFYGDISGYAYGGYLDTLRPKPQFSLLEHWFDPVAPQIWLERGREYTGLYTLPNGSFQFRKMAVKDTVVAGKWPGANPEQVSKMLDTVGLIAFFANLPVLKPGRIVNGQRLDPAAFSIGKSSVYHSGEATYRLATVGRPSPDKSQMTGFGLQVSINEQGRSFQKTYLNLTLDKGLDGSYEGGIYPRWMGDLDGDGRLDLILSWSQRTGSERVVLLLSFSAQPGHFFREVCFYRHDCC